MAPFEWVFSRKPFVSAFLIHGSRLVVFVFAAPTISVWLCRQSI